MPEYDQYVDYYVFIKHSIFEANRKLKYMFGNFWPNIGEYCIAAINTSASLGLHRRSQKGNFKRSK